MEWAYLEEVVRADGEGNLRLGVVPQDFGLVDHAGHLQIFLLGYERLVHGKEHHSQEDAHHNVVLVLVQEGALFRAFVHRLLGLVLALLAFFIKLGRNFHRRGRSAN